MLATQGRGVDIVLNMIPGEPVSSSWKCVAEFGTCIDLNDRKSAQQGKSGVERIDPNKTYISIDLMHLSIHRPKVVTATLQRTIDFWKLGYIEPVMTATKHPATHISECFREIQLDQTIGKYVLSIPGFGEFPPAPIYESLQLHADRSYLFIGGLGGLGRAIATWLVERGATEIVFLSRPAGLLPEHNQFVKELDLLGCTSRLVPGDVSKFDNVVQAIRLRKNRSEAFCKHPSF